MVKSAITLGYQFEITYKKGKYNGVENALLRKEDEIEELLYVISIIQFDCVEEPSSKWKKDKKAWNIIQ